jgi:isopenicillin N synthase-like dioxygenase
VTFKDPSGEQMHMNAPMPDFDSVPLIDFSAMISGDSAARARVAAELRSACTNVGFFYISNHGVPATLIERMFEQCPRLFGLPTEQKLDLHVKKSPHLLGYVGMRDENANPLVGKGDLHEAYDFVAEDAQVNGERLVGDYRKAGNQWPAQLPEFHAVMMEYSIAIRRLARLLFSAFALALNLPEDYFVSISDKPMALIRLLYYPSQPGPFDESKMGTGAHTDHECFTILCQDEVPALQVKNRRGEWINAPRIAGTFVVNIGDLMARWTNGIFASTPHRVANLSGRTRYSIPAFFAANADTVIDALPTCVSADNPAKYPPVVAGEYSSTLIYHHLNAHTAPHALKDQPR